MHQLRPPRPSQSALSPLSPKRGIHGTRQAAQPPARRPGPSPSSPGSCPSSPGVFNPNAVSASMPPPPPMARADPWEERVDPSSGSTYYFNQVTMESAWTKP